jgi:hypothetical protein
MHQLFLPNFGASLHLIEQDSSADNGYTCVVLVSSSTGGHVGCADQPGACVLLVVRTRKFPEKWTQKYKSRNSICIHTFIHCLLIMMLGS